MIEPGLFSKAIDWAVGGLAALFAIVWGALNVRLTEVKKTADEAVPRTEWEFVEARTVVDRALFREDIKELRSRADGLKDHINNKIDGLRLDMNAQFERLLDKISERP